MHKIVFLLMLVPVLTITLPAVAAQKPADSDMQILLQKVMKVGETFGLILVHSS